MSSAELKALRAELSALRIRLEAQEELIEEQGQRIQKLEETKAESGLEESCSVSEVVEKRSEASLNTLGSYSVVTSKGPVSPGDTGARLQLARECGAFLLRALSGDHRQSSGRDRLRLPSKVYVVLADFGGRRQYPARVFYNFQECKALCKSGSSCGQSVFLGFATAWEAEEALVSAGFAWPTPTLWSSVLLGEDQEVKEEYELCHISFSTEGGTAECNIIPIAIVQRKLLVAVPYSAWSRQAAERFLPKTALVKAVLVEVEGVGLEAGGGADAGSKLCHVWVGFLRGDLARSGKVGEVEDPEAVDFAGEAEEKIAPFARPLVELANDHFAFFSAISGAGIDEPEGAAGEVVERVARLEAGIERIQMSLERIAPTSQPKRAAGPKALPGLDPGVLASARQAGIEEDQLQRLSSLLAKPNRMEEGGTASVGRRAKRDELSETEEEDGDELIPDAEEGGAEASGGAMEKAVLHLTKLVSKMSESKKKKGGLEAILERVDIGGSEGLGGSSGSSGRSKAAAFKKLKAALVENPQWIASNIERLMEEDFHQTRSAPGSSSKAMSTRAWIEHRSRVLHYPTTIRTAWIIGGIHDALRQGNISEARARCALAVAAVDQSSLDNGSWTLAQEVLLEAPPPYASFVGKKNPDPVDQPASRLLDERFVELAVWRLKERDSYLESRKRLGAAGRGRGPDLLKTEDRDTPGPKKNPKGKGAKQKGGDPGQRQEERPAEA